MRTTSKGAFLLAAVGILAIGCATPQSQELKQAQQSYSSAKSSPNMTEQAAATLYEARQDLDKAQRADDLDVQKHYAYLAQRKIDLARVQADQVETRREVAALQEQQDRFLLTLRQRQAEMARRQAERAQQELQAYRAQERQLELSRAQQEAQRAQAEAQKNQQELAQARQQAQQAKEQAMLQQQRAQQAQQEVQQAQSETQQLRQQLSGLQSRQTRQGLVLTLSDVVFGFNQADVKPGAERELRRLADWLKQHPDRQVLVEGFTDNVGSQQYNQRLSRERADAVAQALEANGVPRERLTTRGLGENYPVAPNENEAGRQRNRRVEITVLNPNEGPQNAGREGRT